MCYKILKATSICINDHVLERKICWRQCADIQVPNHGDSAPYTRCRDPAIPSIMLKFDILHHTRKTASRPCVMCKSQVDPDYRMQLAAVQTAEDALNAESQRLARYEDSATRLNQTPAAMDVIEKCQQLQQRAAVDLSYERQKLFRVREVVENRARRLIDQIAGFIDDVCARFYYGPTTPEEQQVILSARKDPTLMRDKNECIVDWTVEYSGRYTVRLCEQ